MNRLFRPVATGRLLWKMLGYLSKPAIMGFIIYENDQQDATLP